MSFLGLKCSVCWRVDRIAIAINLIIQHVVDLQLPSVCGGDNSGPIRANRSIYKPTCDAAVVLMMMMILAGSVKIYN